MIKPSFWPTVAAALTFFSLAGRHVSGATYQSTGSGLWNATGVWQGNVNPKTGSTDSVTIQSGNTVTYTGTNVGTTNAANGVSNDFGVANGNTITINGGYFTQTSGGWVRIGNKSAGTLDIQNGGVYLNGPLQVGVETADGAGVINVGDGVGAAGSAVLILNTLIDGTTATSTNVEVNLGNVAGAYGIINILSDGRMEGDTNTGTSVPIRIGRYGAATGPTTQSAINVYAGGQFNVHDVMEVGSLVGSIGLLNLSGAGAKMTREIGQLTVGYTGKGTVIVENGATLESLNGTRADVFFARNAGSEGTLTIRDNGTFIRDTGGSVGDFNLGYAGTATMTVQSGGQFTNNSGNFDWIGTKSGGNGSVYINSGGVYYSKSASVVVGSEAGATGLLQVNGGQFTMAGSMLQIGLAGKGTFQQISGTTSVVKITMSGKGGESYFDMQLGTLSTSSFYVGGDTTDTGTGTAKATQSGGTVNVGGTMSVGASVTDTGSYAMTGGTLNFTAATADVTVGERGNGSMVIGAGATFSVQQTTGQFYVGRENGSSGSLIVDGTMTKTGTTAIRVGQGNASGVNNTTATGLIGGTGTITAAGGIIVGNNGAITGGTKTSVGALNIQGSLSLISTVGSSVQSTLFVNFDSSTTLQADRLTISGNVSLGNAVISGTWAAGSATGVNSRYWVVINSSGNAFQGDAHFANMTLTSTNDWASIYKNMGADGFVTINGQDFAMFYNANFATGALTGGHDLVLSAMAPEPSRALFSLLGISSLLLRRRRVRLI